MRGFAGMARVRCVSHLDVSDNDALIFEGFIFPTSSLFRRNGQPIWVGAHARYWFRKRCAEREGKHKIDPVVDGERDRIGETLQKTGKVKSLNYDLPPNPVQEEKTRRAVRTIPRAVCRSSVCNNEDGTGSCRHAVLDYYELLVELLLFCVLVLGPLQ
jgi:hypothetical protein